jgi:nitroreductase
MSDLMEVIQGRRSIRKYEEKDVPDTALQTLLEAVRWSPSWANTQCWEIIVVKDPDNKERLQATLSQTNPARKAMVQAPLVIALCGKLGISGFYKGQASTKFNDWMMYDLGIATQSLCLAAHDLGLGTVIAGMFDHNEAKGVLGLPEGYEVVSLIPVGYPAHESAAPKRREVHDFARYERF